MLSRMTLFAIVRRAVSLWNTPWARYAALAAIVLVVVQIVRLVVQQFRRPETLDFRSPDRLVDLATLRRPTAETATGLAIHNLPCRLAVVAFAPLGRIQPPRDDEVPAALDRILPGLGAVAERDPPLVQAWPNQVSVNGFANQLARHLHVPGQDLADTAWCVLAGKTQRPDGVCLVGMALGTANPNRLGVLRLEEEADWLRTLQVQATRTIPSGG
jgi:hypothetical protein